MVRIVPKIGPLRNVDITVPSATTEDMYIKSVNQTVDRYRAELTKLQQGPDKFELANLDFDTGQATKPNEYTLADATYAMLVGKLAGKQFALLTPALRNDILRFYGSTPASQPSDLASRERKKVESALAELRELTPAQ